MSEAMFPGESGPKGGLDGEKVPASVRLRFFRHGAKEKGEDDRRVRLTEEGREQALAASKPLENPTLAGAVGSSRDRAKETVVLRARGATDSLDAETQASDLEELAGAGILGTKKLTEDERLNFLLEDVTQGTSKEAYDAFVKGEYLKWLVEHSDARALENGDRDINSTYSKSAANVASIIKDYTQSIGRWEDLVDAEEERSYPKGYEGALERFFGSHQGVTESFLAKVIEKTDGVEARDALVELLGNTGFDFVEGFEVEITTEADEPQLHISYTHKGQGEVDDFVFDTMVGPELLDEIIQEGAADGE